MKQLMFALTVSLSILLTGIDSPATPSIDEPLATNQNNEAWVKSVLEDNVQNLKARNDLGILYLKQQKYDLAIAEFEKAKQIIKHFFVGPAPIATLYTEPETYEALIRKYEDALRIKEEYARTHNNLGIALMEQHKLELARHEFEGAREIHPKSAKAHNNMGILYERLGKLDLAIEEYETALSLESTNEVTLYNLGLAYAKKGNEDISLGFLGRARDLLARKGNTALGDHLDFVMAGMKPTSPAEEIEKPREETQEEMQDVVQTAEFQNKTLPVVRVSVSEEAPSIRNETPEQQLDPVPDQEQKTETEEPQAKVLNVLPEGSEPRETHGEDYSNSPDAMESPDSLSASVESDAMEGRSNSGTQSPDLGDWLFLYPK